MLRDVAAAKAALISRAELERRLASSRRIAAAVGDGSVVRVHPGWYVDGERWRQGHSEERHLLKVVAAHLAQRGTDAVMVGVSAAVLHGLPLYRSEPSRVHTAGSQLSGHVRASPWIARHEIAVADADRVSIDGILCTSLARTVADVLRWTRPEVALSIADAALRSVAWDDGTRAYDEPTAAAFRSAVFERMHRTRGARGVRQGRWLLGLADGRAQLPAESVSRLHLVELGFATPRLQVRVPGPRGDYFVDFGLDDVDAWGECDGDVKYLDPNMRNGRTIEQVLLHEKQREDWIRGTTRRPLVRWGPRHIGTASDLGRRLAAFGIRPPR
jgi:hypothetical protein